MPVAVIIIGSRRSTRLFHHCMAWHGIASHHITSHDIASLPAQTCCSVAARVSLVRRKILFKFRAPNWKRVPRHLLRPACPTRPILGRRMQLSLPKPRRWIPSGKTSHENDDHKSHPALLVRSSVRPTLCYAVRKRARRYLISPNPKQSLVAQESELRTSHPNVVSSPNPFVFPITNSLAATRPIAVGNTK